MKAFCKRIIIALLIAEARLLLRRKNPTIVAITGSVGKTSTKDAIYAAIKGSVPARKSHKGFNSDIGIPLSILGLRNAWNNPLYWIWNVIDGLFVAVFTQTYPAVLVIETGVDAPGDMQRIASWLKPDVVVVTRLPDVPVHVEQFVSPEAQRAEEMAIITSMNASGVVIYNADDQNIKDLLPTIRQKTLGFARYSDADVQATEHQIYYQDDRPAGMRTTLAVADAGTTHEVTISGALGVSQVYSVAAALAVASHLGVDAAEATAGLQQLQTPAGRMRILPTIKGGLMIDDSYNSSPVAVEHALEQMAQVRHTGRRVVVLGDMLELGSHTTHQHELLGQTVARTADVLYTVGVRARGFAVGALNGGMDEEHIKQYEHADRAGRELQADLQPGDLILVKGSQSIRTEKIVKEIMAQPEKAEELLVRQEAAWR